jgi:hypothetical protein
MPRSVNAHPTALVDANRRTRVEKKTSKREYFGGSTYGSLTALLQKCHNDIQ